MIEKVNPSHPDKLADRIAGALVDMAYATENDPRIAVEVLLGHGTCNIIAESSVRLEYFTVEAAVQRITKKNNMLVDLLQYPQDFILAKNQKNRMRCGDNGIFKGMPLTDEECDMSYIARDIYGLYQTDGKYILDRQSDRLIICQSCAARSELLKQYPGATINPLGEWTGGIDVDSGATNRKLGSDMGRSVTGGGLHGKDLSKADVSVNIYAFLEAQRRQQPVELCCAIGDETIDGKPYEEIVSIARNFITSMGGFEKFAEWGLF